MVHWPEVMVEYETTEKVLFSADGFGKFGALSHDEDWACEARRYYFNIVGKYGAPVQTLLKKASTLDIKMICPLHGPILKDNLGYYIDKYQIWSSYQSEDEGVLVASASIHGNTKEVALKVVDLLKEKGVTSALLNAGGNVCTIGTPPDSDSWNVGIQDPDDTTKIYDKISVSDKSVVTSGNYQRYYTVNGKIYHHIIDPETLMPADLYKNVTVITGDSQIADMLSTALFILPYDDGKKLAQQYGADVLWIFTDGHAEKTF